MGSLSLGFVENSKRFAWPTGGGDAAEAAFAGAVEDGAIGSPGAAAGGGGIADNDRSGATIGIDSPEFPIGGIGDVSVVGRPERIAGAGRAGQVSRSRRLQRTHPQAGNSARGRHIGDHPAVLGDGKATFGLNLHIRGCQEFGTENPLGGRRGATALEYPSEDNSNGQGEGKRQGPEP